MVTSPQTAYENADGILVLDSIGYVAQPGFKIAGRLIVSGSHGGKAAVAYVLEHAEKPDLVFFNDAGGGLDQAGTSGLAQLESIGVAACAYSHWTAHIGDAPSGLATGVISTLNSQARAKGLRTGMRVAAAILHWRNS